MVSNSIVAEIEHIVVFDVGKTVTRHKIHKHAKKDIGDDRIPECTIGSNCTNKLADPGVHFLKRYVYWLIKRKENFDAC